MIPEEVWQMALAMAVAEGDASHDKFHGGATERLWIARATLAVEALRKLGWELAQYIR